MSQVSRTIVMLPLQTLTATKTVIVNVPEFATGFIGLLGVGTVTGTSPTLDVKVEQLIANAVATDSAGLPSRSEAVASYNAIGYGLFAQISSTAVKQFSVGAGVGQVVASQGNPTADNFRAAGPVGARWKVTFTVAGTSPSFANAYMVVQFFGNK